MLGNRTAMEWVIDRGRMAVGPRVRTLPAIGDRLVLYTSRGAFHNPTRDRAQILALGVTSSEPDNRRVVVAGAAYARSFAIDIDVMAEPRRGLDFLPLVPRLDFIHNRASWGGALRRPVVHIGDKDYKTIAAAFREGVPTAARVP